MDIEQLKLILETVSAVSGDAVTVVIGYLIVSNVLPFCGWMAALYAVVKIAKILLGKAFAQSDEEFFRAARDNLGIGSSGYLSDEERTRVKQRLREMIAVEKVKPK